MKETILRTSMLILFLILTGSLILGIIKFSSLNYYMNGEQKENLSYQEQPKYHFMVIIDGTNSSYVKEFKRGMIKANEELNIAIEFWEITGPDKIEDIIRQVDIAINSGVDGIILDAYNNNSFKDIINEAHQKGIPVVTISEDVPESERISHVGLSKFHIGSEVGNLLNDTISGSGDIIVLQRSSSSEENISEKSDGLISLGIRDTIENDNLQVKVKNYTGETILSAEDITMQLLDDEKNNIKAIVCTNGQDTLGVVQVLIDFNKISNISVVGYEDLPEILDYIETEIEVINGTIVTDYNAVGYSSVSSLFQYKEEGIVSNYSDVNVKIITKNNIELYRKELSGTNEED